MADHDINMSLLATARMTHIDSNRRQQRRQAIGREEAEDRAFFAERAQRHLKDDVVHEQQEHELTKLALQRLIAQSEAMRRTFKMLAERWAPLEGVTVDAMASTFVHESEAMAQGLLDKPGNGQKLEREVERLRDAQRVVPKRPEVR